MNFNKLYKKYAGSPIRPPKPESEIEVNVPVSADEPEDKWIQLLQKSEGLDPLTEKPAESPGSLLQRLVEPDPDNDMETPQYEKELLKALNPEYKENKIAPDASTIPPPGKKSASLTPDTLLKMCSKYHDLCHKP
jgi:hypothetical protein